MKMEGPKNGNNAPGRKRDRDFFPLKKITFNLIAVLFPFLKGSIVIEAISI